MKQLIIIAVTITFIATTSFAYIIEPGLVEYVAETKTFDSLVISGTLFCANFDPAVPGSQLDITIIITNGDFILCQGGSITQTFDFNDASTKGADGNDGFQPDTEPTDGEQGFGLGEGGKGGNGYDSATYPATNQASIGAIGGNGGGVGGNGGFGGYGGDGAGGVDIGDPAYLNGRPGNKGGTGGEGGNGVAGYRVTIINTTCGGKIDLTAGSLNLTGQKGGSGGEGGLGGDGGEGYNDVNWGGNGGQGGTGSNGGNGGNGRWLYLYASNGYIYVNNFETWVSGGVGGNGGDGGDGGTGGDGAVGQTGEDGPLGYAGNGGNGGDGGSMTINAAAKIYTNGVRISGQIFAPLYNEGKGGNGGDGLFGGGTKGDDGMEHGNYLFKPDVQKPDTTIADPVILPETNAVFYFNVETNIIFNTLQFTDNISAQHCLRHTIQIVPTNNVYGPALTNIAREIYNIQLNRNQSFITEESWIDYGGLYFRFLTFDKADNVKTNFYPAGTQHVFSVIPEPGLYLLFIIYNLLFISRWRKLKS